MKKVKTHIMGPVKGFEYGYNIVGRPWMTVYSYYYEGILVDTGLSNIKDVVKSVVSSLPVQVIVLTHHHEDHSGNAAGLKSLKKVPVLGHKETKRIMKEGFKILPYQYLVWGPAEMTDIEEYGQVIQSGDKKLHPIYTPGHSIDHTIYWEKNEGWIFSGDLFVAEHIKYFRFDEDIHEQILSLKKVLNLEFDTILCAHRPQMQKGKAKIRNKLQFFEDFVGTVTDLHRQGFAEKAIMKEIGMRETLFVKYMTCGTVSLRNMVHSVLK